jgi:phosphoribosylglycinamide formyltransferase-1
VIDRGGRARAEHDAEIITKLRERNVEFVCLAGYMRLLSKEFVRAFANRIVNIHPSLLPNFKGLDAQKQALEAGALVSGCTVHYVDEELDHGAIIAQKTVPILPGDTVESLSARILVEEHKLYVAALKEICTEPEERIARKTV